MLLHGIDGAEQVGRTVGEQIAQSFEQQAEQSADADNANANPTLLRPPGAMAEHLFVDTCSKCGTCSDVCPANCIVLDVHIDQGRPHIVARDSPCVICTELSCTHHCPTGALSPITDPREIRMGLAIVDEQTCLLAHDQPCDQCVTQCPIGADAIVIDGSGRVNILTGCTGCGVCENVCPTGPASISIVPDQPIVLVN